MNKTAIKNYAVWARNELIKQVTQKAYEYEVTNDGVPNINTVSVNGRLLSNDEKNQLRDLILQVNKYGFVHVVEEIAYTWFNRFIALRYMEVNNYLPQKVRIFTNENNEFKPEILTEAIHLDLDNLDKQKVFDYIQNNNQEDLYKYLLLTICNDMNKYLPDMFTSIKDYKALLLPDNLLKEDSVLDRLVKDIDEDSFKDQVQIIGWMYQYYNSELKDIVMKKKEYSKDDIPAATQLFTPDWIVRYMVENSLGRLWVDGHPNFNHDNWRYYLEEAEQEPEVIEQLNKIKEEHAKLKPEDIKVLEPCMGSGHILVYAFDVLMDVYRDSGYSDRDAAQSILENNLYGLELDERAYHLAYFALMMKARSFNRKILSKETKVNVLEIRESSPLKKEHKQYLGKHVDLANYLVDSFKDAKELGSIINLDCTLEQLDELNTYLSDLKDKSESLGLVEQVEIHDLDDVLKPLIRQAILLVQKYDAVITNPPYMAPNGIEKIYVQKHYPDSKSDLCTVFIEKCRSLTKKNAYQAMITMHSWMFLSSYEKLRSKLLDTSTLINMAHLGARAFDEIGGEVVQTTTFIFQNNSIKDYLTKFKRLVDYNTQDLKEEEYLKDNNLYITSSNNFNKIPGSPIAYWVNKRFIDSFKMKQLSYYGEIITGMTIGDNNKYLRLWHEVSNKKIAFSQSDIDEINLNDTNWIPYSKGGQRRNWYGNYDYIVNWSKSNKFNRPKSTMKRLYLKRALTWPFIKSGNFSARRLPMGSLWDVAGSPCFFKDEVVENTVLAFLCSKVANYIIKIINPTINVQAIDINHLPLDINYDLKTKCHPITIENCDLSRKDWDSFETSWDFIKHPLVPSHMELLEQQESQFREERMAKFGLISWHYDEWSNDCDYRFNTLKSNEEELNRIFIDIYGLQEELDPYVEDKDVTVRKADLTRDIKSLISYAVGCMFGRYSLDVQGLAYAGGEFDNSKYKTYLPDKDNIIPICDEEYFEDDIVSRFVEFIKVVYGKDSLEENLQFIANALGGNGNSREVLRNYFLNDFFKDHCNTYQVTGSGKRPIYWQFDSGKNNGFKALIYMHRYTPDLIARLRTTYIHPLQSRLRTQIDLLNKQIDDASNTSEKVKLSKQLKKLNDQLLELNKYEEKVHHYADMMIDIDLDDGVKVNYAKFDVLLSKTS